VKKLILIVFLSSTFLATFVATDLTSAANGVGVRILSVDPPGNSSINVSANGRLSFEGTLEYNLFAGCPVRIEAYYWDESYNAYLCISQWEEVVPEDAGTLSFKLSFFLPSTVNAMMSERIYLYACYGEFSLNNMQEGTRPIVYPVTWAQPTHLKIVGVSPNPSAVEIGDNVTYQIEVEYNLPQEVAGEEPYWVISATVSYYDEDSFDLDTKIGRPITIHEQDQKSGTRTVETFPGRVPEGTSLIVVRATAYASSKEADEYHDLKWFYIEQDSEPASEPAYRLRIISVDYPFTVEPAEEFAVNVEYEYEFADSTPVSIGIFDKDSETRLEVEFFDLEGNGTEVAPFIFVAPPKEGILHLSADGYYQKDDSWVHDEDGWYEDFNIEVKSSNTSVETEIRMEMETEPNGVVADGVSSLTVTVTLPINATGTVTLTDGVIQLKGIPTNGQVDFTYIPNVNKLGLQVSDIPKGGFEVKLTATVEDTQTSASTSIKVYRRPVLLVHGTWSSSATWKKMAHWLREDGFTVYTVDWPATESVMIVATNHLAKRIDEIRRDFLKKYDANATRIDIIAHSGGGLVARYYIAMRHDPRLWPGHKPPRALYVHTLILVGTTNLGSPLAPVYMDVLLNNPRIRDRLMLMLIQAIPGHFLLKYGPLIEEQFPDSELLTLLNSMPNDPEVHYYTICGTKNWAGGLLGRLIRFYGIHIYDRTLLERITGPGDGVVDLHSQRYPEKFGKGSGYYVYASHTAETSSREVFIIASNILKGTKDRVAIYKTPLSPKLTVRRIIPQPGEGRFLIQNDGGFLGTWRRLHEGDELKPNEAIRITFSGQTPQEGETAAVLLEVTKMGKVEGRIIIRVKGPNIPQQVEVYVLSATALYVPPGAELYIKYDGPITIITNTASIASPDPELTVAVNLQNQTQITLIDGELQVADLHGQVARLTSGQEIMTYPDEPMGQPSQASYEKWWVELTEEEIPPFDILIGLLVLATPIVFIAAAIRHLLKRRREKRATS